MVAIFGHWKGNTVNIFVHKFLSFCWIFPLVTFPKREMARVEGCKHLHGSSGLVHVGILASYARKMSEEDNTGEQLKR